MSMIPVTDLKSLPKISGIYKVVKNIYQRWNNGHHKLAQIIAVCGTNAYITWVQVPEWLLNRAENAAIAFYKPPLNMKNTPIV